MCLFTQDPISGYFQEIILENKLLLMILLFCFTKYKINLGIFFYKTKQVNYVSEQFFSSFQSPNLRC